MKQTIVLGNIITMDEKRPFARAALVKDGVFAYIGSAEEAKKLAGADAKVLDYGKLYLSRLPGVPLPRSSGRPPFYRTGGPDAGRPD